MTNSRKNREVCKQEDLPFTQVNVALEFLKERGLVDVRHRRCYPATRDVYLDALVEFHALAHTGAQRRELGHPGTGGG